MATLEAPEDDYDFVERPSKDFFCPVTFDLLKEPHLTPCCGNHLSQKAVTRLQGQPCPVCMKPNLNPVHDKFFRRQVNELQVRCRNKSLGCEWVGELGSLDRHLSQSSVEGECQFVTVACPYSCGDSFQRRHVHTLEEHKVNYCPNRPFTCQYCDYKATYMTVTIDHWLICMKYPVECPNHSLGCPWAGEQGDLDLHLNVSSVEGECQLVTVACPYDCGDDLQRCQLEGHKMYDCPSRPFSCQYCNYEATYTEVTTEHWPVCERYPLQCPNECGGDMIERQNLEEHLDEECLLQVVECKFSYAGCEVECQRQHMQDHVNENVASHLSLVSTVVEKKIPRQDSTITKLQSRIEQQQKKIALQDSTITELQSTIKPQQKQIKKQDSTIKKLLTTTEQLQQQIVDLTSALAVVEEKIEKQEELKDNVKEQDSTIKKLQTTIEQLQKQIMALAALALNLQMPLAPIFVSPPDIVMTDFEKHKRADDRWHSPPFYTHIGGYKMYFNVDANGNGVGEDTHVSIFFYLMRGEYDDQLKWPFRGTITIQLLNQRRDEGHQEKTVHFGDRTDDDVSGRVVGKEKASCGWGYHKFIAHSDLSTEDKKYLKNDCLKFRITKAVIKST